MSGGLGRFHQSAFTAGGSGPAGTLSIRLADPVWPRSRQATIGTRHVAYQQQYSRRSYLPVSSPAEPEWDYGIMIDAGSSGTRLNVYQWASQSQREVSGDCSVVPAITAAMAPGDADGKEPLPSKPVSFKIKGGLANVSSPDRVWQYFGDAIAYAQRSIPGHKHKSTPIYLKGTGGLRLLAADKATPILREVERVLAGSGFQFDQENAVKVITGESEGLFSWLSVNYLGGRFADQRNTLGLLEMGGASVQIALAPEVTRDQDRPHIVNLKLNGTSHAVYSETFSTSGTNEARHHYQRTQLESPADGSDVLADPCFVRGYQGTTQEGQRFVGYGNFTQCLSRMTALSFAAAPGQKEEGQGGGPSIIPNTMPLLAISAFPYTYNWFQCTEPPHHTTSTINCLLTNASQQCTDLTLDEYAAAHPGRMDEYSYEYCFNAAHMITTLRTGFGLAPDRPLTVSNFQGGQELSWTLGAMIFEVNRSNQAKCLPGP